MTSGIPYTYDRNGQLVVDPAELIASPAFREQVRAAARLQEPTVTTRPSNEAIAQAFWEIWGQPVECPNLVLRAREIDAQSCAVMRYTR